MEIAVVCQRKTLQGCQETGQVTDEAACLATRELCDVGILLLRHDARPGGIAVAELDVIELGGCPNDDLFTESAEVDADQACDEGEFSHDIA